MISAVRFPPEGSGPPELKGVGGALRQVSIKAGHVSARHHHDFEQFLYVVSGHGRLECEQGSIPLEPGTALHLPPGSWHSAEFMADTVLLESNLSA